MKNFNSHRLITLFSVSAFCLLSSCNRDADELRPATFADNPNVFLDTFSAGLDYFPYEDSKQEAFSVDDETFYEGTASMRFDVPDRNVGYAGAIFRDENGGRDLTNYNVLTFWAKATVSSTVEAFGFGQDFGDNRYEAKISNVRLTTNWEKYIIPIPDPSRLTQERGMFWYSTSADNGYTFWVDEIKFENLGTVAQPLPKIFGGDTLVETTFNKVKVPISINNISVDYSLPNGSEQVVNAGYGYFDYLSSDPATASVDERGIVTVNRLGSAVITASVRDQAALGALSVTSVGDFEPAPTPTTPEADVVSVFSDAYTNKSVDYYNGFFIGDGQTTQGGLAQVEADDGSTINYISYTQLNFVGIGILFPTLNVSEMTHVHLDLNVRETVDSGDFIDFQLLNDVGGNETSGTVRISSATLQTEEWVGVDIPLSSFSGLATPTDIDLIFFISQGSISNVFVDNLYFYRE